MVLKRSQQQTCVLIDQLEHCLGDVPAEGNEDLLLTHGDRKLMNVVLKKIGTAPILYASIDRTFVRQVEHGPDSGNDVVIVLAQSRSNLLLQSPQVGKPDATQVPIFLTAVVLRGSIVVFLAASLFFAGRGRLCVS